jgi:hypothetical protein
VKVDNMVAPALLIICRSAKVYFDAGRRQS